MQSSCLRLMGRKLLVSLAMEGKFSREGLQSLDEDDDMLTAMARELVIENGVGDSASAIWRQIQAKHNTALIPAGVTSEPLPVVEDTPLSAALMRPAQTVEAAVNAPKFGARPPSLRPIVRRREPPPADVQFPLF
jgi:hypothetical protein